MKASGLTFNLIVGVSPVLILTEPHTTLVMLMCSLYVTLFTVSSIHNSLSITGLLSKVGNHDIIKIEWMIIHTVFFQLLFILIVHIYLH